MLMYKMTKCVGYWKQFRSNSGNGCSTSQGVLGHRWYWGVHQGGTGAQVLRGTPLAQGVQGPRYWGVHDGAEGYKVRPLPSCSFPQHKYTSIRDAATHTQEKSSITHSSIFHKTRIMLFLEPTEMSIWEEQHRCSCLALNKTVRRGRRNSQESRKSWPSQQRTNTEVEFN